MQIIHILQTAPQTQAAFQWRLQNPVTKTRANIAFSSGSSRDTQAEFQSRVLNPRTNNTNIDITTCQPASQLARQLASQRHTAARQPVSEPTSQPLSQPASQPATQPVSQQMTSHQLGIQLASQPGSQPAASQPASQPASQLASQPQHLNQGYKISPKIIANILHKYFILSTQKAYKYYIPPKHLAATEALFQSMS